MLIARRTVTTDLTSIYRKIGVSSRAELAAAVTRHQRESGGTEGTGTRVTDRRPAITSAGEGRPA